MRESEAAVLCGGLGSRLRPLTYYFQKTMLPIGKEQRPILEYIVRSLMYHGVKKAVLLANYKFEQIKNYFGDGSKFGLEIYYGMDSPELKGSGGALLNAYKNGLLDDDRTLLVYYGDILTTMNIRKMLSQHERSGAVATLAVSRELQLPVGVAKMRGKAIVKFEEKPRIRINVGTGIIAFSSKALNVLDELGNRVSNIDIMGNLLPELLRRGLKVEGYVFDDFWLDVGSIETYEKIDHEKVDELFSKMTEVTKVERHV